MSRYQHTMESLRQIVMTEYRRAPRQAQNAAQQFFNAMDRDGSGSVDYREFKYFLISEGFQEFSDKGLFRRLDRDGSKGLDFWEVMSLYYIIKSGKPFCDKCDDFLLNAYFVCNNCRGGPFYFCNNCYQQHNYEVGGEHNYSAYTQPRGHSMQRSQTYSNAMVTYSPAGNSSQFSASRSSSVGGNSSLRTAFRAFEVALNVANLAAGAASCSIM